MANRTNSSFFSYGYNSTTFPSNRYDITGLKDELVKSNMMFENIQNEILKRAKKNDIIFINIRYPFHFIDKIPNNKIEKFRYFNVKNQFLKKKSKLEFFNKWLLDLEELSNNMLSKGVKVIISTPTPEFPSAKFKECIGQDDAWFNTLNKKECTTSKSFYISKKGTYVEIINRLNDLAAKQENLYIFDSLAILCPDGECRFSVNGNNLYKDNDHLSHYSVRNLISPAMYRFLMKNQIVLD